MSEDNVFTNIPTTPSETIENDNEEGSYRARLVGEGKKFRDEEALARGKWESDQYIKTLEEKLDAMNKELGTRMSIEDFLKTQKERNNVSSPQGNPPVNEQLVPDASKKESLTKDDIASIVREALTVEQTKANRNVNISEAKKAMADVWGASASTKINEAVDRLGLGKDFLNDIAARSPKAFLELVGATKQETKGNNNSPPVNQHRQPQSGYNPNVRNKLWWDELKKTNPKEYLNEANTVKRHKDALAMGPAFFKE